jgi:hypothetical protein
VNRLIKYRWDNDISYSKGKLLNKTVVKVMKKLLEKALFKHERTDALEKR